jgi:hypothetical protein
VKIKNITSRQAQLKFHESEAEPFVLGGSEMWTLTENKKEPIEASETHCIRAKFNMPLAKLVRNEDIKRNLRILNRNTIFYIADTNCGHTLKE